MFCKRCEYPLWNLRARTCPECGQPFKPGDYEFVPDSVRFCCPHCGQDYYGTGEKGHLVPDEFDCVKCGNHLRMDDMVLLPTAGVAEEQTKVDVVPWLDRASVGFFKGWLGTLGLAMVGPRRLARAVPTESRLASAFWFAMLTACVYLTVGGAILVPLFLGASMVRRAGDAFVILLCVPIAITAVIALWALAAHFILRLACTTGHGLSRTFTCVCYSTGACVIVAVPCIGVQFLPIAWVWMAISLGFMLSATHGVSKLRAMLAAILPPLVMVVALVAWFLISVLPPIRTTIATAGPMMAQARAQLSTTRMVTALSQYSVNHNGAEPPHGLALIEEACIAPLEIFVNLEPATPADWLISGVNIETVAEMSPAGQAIALNKVAKDIPTGAVAHRLGDMVFTYHGIDLSANSKADPNLWVVICAPTAPPQMPVGLPPMPIYVGTLGGTAVPIAPAQLPAMLAKQNELRAAAGLAPLPDPLTVQQTPKSSAPPDESR